MPGLHLSFSFAGDRQLDRRLERFVLGVRNAAPAFEILAERFLTMERKQFASQGAWGSGGWAPLSPAYAAWKERHYPGRPILEREGDLVGSLTQGPAIRVVEASFAVFGTDVPYGRYHQTGTPRMPRRRPIELTLYERRAWVKVIQRWIVGQTAEDAAGAAVLYDSGDVGAVAPND